MKRILVAGLGLVALAAVQPSFAADRPIPYKALPPAAIFNWTGFYVGADVGYVWSNVDAFEPAAPAFGTATADPNSFTIGGHIGYRYQFPNAFVLGIEGDLAWLDGQDTGAFPGLPPVGFLVNTKWDASVRGILGFAVNRSLFYVTGGASWLNGNGCAVLFVAPTTCLAGTGISSTFSGWTIGGGIAYAFTDNLIGRIEYLHADYGTKAFAGPGFAGGVANVSVTTDKVRAGLSWRFAGPY
jgi:outer membrane immunogenic protein